MPYAILRFEKPKGGAMVALENHHERKKEKYESNPDIDLSRTYLNYHIVSPRQSYRKEIDKRIEETGEENIFSATEIIGNRTKLSEWQDKFYDYMSAEFPELDRGEPAVETKRKHIPMRLFKMATQLDAEIEKIKNEIESVNNFNAGKKRDKVLDMLAKWCYKANSFDKQITQLKTTLEIEKDNNQYYKKQMERAQIRNNILENENIDLLQSQQELREFIESIPVDLRNELLERFEEQQAFDQAEYFNWQS